MTTLRLDPRSTTPIWSQIEQQLCLLVARGRLTPGDAVPSVRELARELMVNPATVSKAYQRLCDLGVLEVRRGQGTFVAESHAAEHSERIAAEVERGLEQFIALAQTAGWSHTEAKRRLDAVWATLESGSEPTRSTPKTSRTRRKGDS